MAEIVVFGVAAVDVMLRLGSLPGPGDQISAEPLGWRLGGSSANVACGLSSAGHHVLLVGPVGSDPIGDELLTELGRRGVDTRYVFRAPTPSPRALVLLDSTGERTIIAVEGRVNGGQPAPVYLPKEVPDLLSADCVYVEGFTRYPPGLVDDAAAALLVTSPPAGGATYWPADVVVGSETQYADGARADPYPSVRAAAGSRLQWVVATRGSSGADAYGADRYAHCSARPTRQVDATGAGDAFTAGLVHGLLIGEDIEAAMNLGSAWGAEAVTRMQSTPPEWIELIAASRQPGAGRV